MDKDQQFEEFILRGSQTFLQHLSVDCVIFGFHENQLKVLLIKWKEGGQWSLPGGFVKKKETIDGSAIRTLKERTGLDDIFLHQFYTFGDPLRGKNKIHLKKIVSDSWLQERFVSVGYYALVEYSKVNPKPDWLTDECRWWDIHGVPKLVLDHNGIVARALEALRQSLNDHPVGFNLLPVKFTMPQLQRLYETILNKSLDRRNFQKKMLRSSTLERLKERKTGGAHKAPYFYRFDLRNYKRALKEGLTGEW
jgi:8-oxo-dGTP diphosphatase